MEVWGWIAHSGDMENQPILAPIQDSVPSVTTPPPSTQTLVMKPNWLVIILSVLVVGLISSLAVLYLQNQQLKNQLTYNSTKAVVATYDECTQLEGAIIQESYPSVCVAPSGNRFTQEVVVSEEVANSASSDSTVEVTSPTANALDATYSSSSLKFQINYPSTWRVTEYSTGIGFGPKEVGEDTLWGITSYGKDKYTKEKLIDELGKQFSDINQTTEVINISDVSATKVITTTPSIVDWRLETIILERESDFVVINNGAMTDLKLLNISGVPAGTRFENFYSSFKLI